MDKQTFHGRGNPYGQKNIDIQSQNQENRNSNPEMQFYTQQTGKILIV